MCGCATYNLRMIVATGEVLTVRGFLLAGLVMTAMAAPAFADRVSSIERVAAVQTSASLPMAERIVVKKSERRMLLLRDESILREYSIKLGLNPSGHKERSGDFRTPEGSYRLVRRNARSEFFLSMQVSYPNPVDVRNARRNGWDPGGSIMIHGLPNTMRHSPEYYATRDWTDGCIAVTNADMIEIWLLTPDNVPIDIEP